MGSSSTPARLILASICASLLMIAYSKLHAADPKLKAKHGVAKIRAAKPDNVVESGAAVVIYMDNDKIYMITAYHVIDDADSIEVRFSELPTKRFSGSIFEKYDGERDLGIIYVDAKKMPNQIIIPLKIADPSKTSELEKIIAVGHPRGREWELSSGEIRSTDRAFLRFSGDAVSPGNSGGALLNDEYKLIGIVTKEETDQGIAVRIDEAFKILDQWKLPHYAIPKGNKKWLWIVAGAARAAGGIAAVLLKPETASQVEVEFPAPPGRPPVRY